MRLKRSEADALSEVVREVMGEDVRLFLFGSRIDPRSKGGDIDLLLLTPSDSLAAMRQKRARLVAALHKRLGDRRIDCTIADADAGKQSTFVRSVLAGGVVELPHGLAMACPD
jgi:predicted nucleotidyltransferase